MTTYYKIEECVSSYMPTAIVRPILLAKQTAAEPGSHWQPNEYSVQPNLESSCFHVIIA